MLDFIFKSYNKKVLEAFIAFLKATNKAAFSSISFPKKVKRITLLRSPHVYKKAKAQYQELTYNIKVRLACNPTEIELKFNSIINNLPKTISLKVISKI